MAEQIPNTFIEWLEVRLNESHLTVYQLAKKAKISNTVFMRARQGKVPKWKACVAIANALEVDPTEVFRAAGLILPVPQVDPDFEEFWYYCKQLLPEYQKLVFKLLRLLADEEIGWKDAFPLMG